jgi:hypothetical protein
MQPYAASKSFKCDLYLQPIETINKYILIKSKNDIHPITNANSFLKL